MHALFVHAQSAFMASCCSACGSTSADGPPERRYVWPKHKWCSKPNSNVKVVLCRPHYVDYRRFGRFREPEEFKRYKTIKTKTIKTLLVEEEVEKTSRKTKIQKKKRKRSQTSVKEKVVTDEKDDEVQIIEPTFLCAVCTANNDCQTQVMCVAGHTACLSCWVQWNKANGYGAWNCFMQVGCSLPISQKSFQLLTSHDRELMDKRARESYLKLSSSWIECDCHLWFETTGETGVIVCPHCKEKKYCGGCKKPIHEGFTCDEMKNEAEAAEEKKQRETLAQELITLTQGIRCPSLRCGEVIEKRGGCNHIVCSTCKTHICYVCGKDIGKDGASPYNHFRGPFDYGLILLPLVNPQVPMVRPEDHRCGLYDARPRPVVNLAELATFLNES